MDGQVVHFHRPVEARRRGIPFARIACETPLREAVFRQALPEGAFELRH